MIWANNLNRKLVVIAGGNKFRLYQMMANGECDLNFAASGLR